MAHLPNTTIYPEFEGCFDNDSAQTYVEDLKRTPEMLKNLYGYPELVLSFVSLVINILFTRVCISGMKSKILSKRLYLFLLNRSVGDMLALLESFLVAPYILIAQTNSTIAVIISNDLVC